MSITIHSYKLFSPLFFKIVFYIELTARRSNQSIQKEIKPGISLEGMMLKLKTVLWPPHVKS